MVGGGCSSSKNSLSAAWSCWWEEEELERWTQSKRDASSSEGFKLQGTEKGVVCVLAGEGRRLQTRDVIMHHRLSVLRSKCRSHKLLSSEPPSRFESRCRSFSPLQRQFCSHVCEWESGGWWQWLNYPREDRAGDQRERKRDGRGIRCGTLCSCVWADVAAEPGLSLHDQSDFLSFLLKPNIGVINTFLITTHALMILGYYCDE